MCGNFHKTLCVCLVQKAKSEITKAKTMTSAAVVRVGVGVLVESSEHLGKVLFGKRLGSHGSGTFALPGGHLEIGETWEQCAIREVKEETNLDVVNLRFCSVTNSINMGGNPQKHYVTIFMRANVATTSESLTNMEPQKCEQWEWIAWKEIVEKRKNTPHLLFDPMIHFIDGLPRSEGFDDDLFS